MINLQPEKKIQICSHEDVVCSIVFFAGQDRIISIDYLTFLEQLNLPATYEVVYVNNKFASVADEQL